MLALQAVFKQAKGGNMTQLEVNLRNDLQEAEYKAWNALAGYKFQMFGYWAAIWVHLNKIGGFKQPNPWGQLTKQAAPKARVAQHKIKGTK